MSKLLPNGIRAELPPLYATEGESVAIARVKFFTPWTNWTWYVIEFDGEDICFGLVDGHELELGYFSLVELESIQGPGGLWIERDEHFEPTPLPRLKQDIEAIRSGHLPRSSRHR